MKAYLRFYALTFRNSTGSIGGSAQKQKQNKNKLRGP
jgi:hypothetical protein